MMAKWHDLCRSNGGNWLAGRTACLPCTADLSSAAGSGNLSNRTLQTSLSTLLCDDMKQKPGRKGWRGGEVEQALTTVAEVKVSVGLMVTGANMDMPDCAGPFPNPICVGDVSPQYLYAFLFSLCPVSLPSPCVL